jgi:hypothetical protein
MQPVVGAKVGRFTLMRPIDEDDERTLWLGSHDAFGTMQLAAIELPPEGNPDPARAVALRREADVASNLSHEGIRRVLEVGEMEGGAFIAREYFEGTTLARLQGPLEALRGTDDPLRLACIAHIVGGILDVLAHTHAIETVPDLGAGVVHGQLTPQDVLVSTHGKIKISGFGLDRRPPQDGTAGMMSHDALRCTPTEQLHNPELTPALDIYGVGILLHTLLDGQPPWPGVEGAELYRMVLSSMPPRMQHALPAELEAIHAALVAPLPQRVASAEAAAQMLRQWPSLKPDVSMDLGQLVRRVRTPGPSQDPFDLASQTSSEIRPMVPPSASSSPGPALASAPGSLAGAPMASGPAFSTPPGPVLGPAGASGPAFVSPTPAAHAPALVSPPGLPGSPAASPVPAFVSPSGAGHPGVSGSTAPAGSDPRAPGPAAAPSHAAPPFMAPSGGSSAGAPLDDGTAMIDPETLARMREEARAARPAPAEPSVSAAPSPSSTGSPAAPSSMRHPAAVRPEAASGVVGSSAQPPSVVIASDHRPTSVVVDAAMAQKLPAQPYPAASPVSKPAPAKPSTYQPSAPKPPGITYPTTPDVGEGTTTAMLVRRERRSLALILVGGALVSILLGLVVAYLVFL